MQTLFHFRFLIGKPIYLGNVRGLNSACGVVSMSWRDLACLCIIILGAVLFLYGSNYYNATVGSAGTFLMIGGFLTEAILKIYDAMGKKETGQKP